MLQRLTIENIAVIKRVELEFIPGFTVMTGETGAGKSIVIDAINAVLGERVSRELIRTGAQAARVTASFAQPCAAAAALLEALGLPMEEGELLLSRSFSAAGRNDCRVNGTPVTVSMLKRVGMMLINIHGQHDTQALLDPPRHMEFIDALAENGALREEYRASYLRLRALQREQDGLFIDETEKSRRLDMLRHQIEELEEAEIRPGERAKLLERQAILNNYTKIVDNLQAANLALAGGDTGAAGAAALARESADAVERAAAFLPAAQKLCETVRSAAYELEESAGELRAILDSVSLDPLEADAIERRLDTYYRLSRKYGASEEEMLAFLAAARAEEASVTHADERIAALDSEIESRQNATIQLAKQLSKTRREGAQTLIQRVKEELFALDMPHVHLEVQSEKTPLTEGGGERMEFLISTNPGEAPRPLARVASGGELSRIMLAMKRVLAEKDDIGTLIFDEIDTGVSGRAAQKIGRKLKEVSKGPQVICVTHLAQIAALADCHLRISKTSRAEETETSVARLDHEGRREELARIMGGENVTAAQLAAAEEMLNAEC